MERNARLHKVARPRSRKRMCLSDQRGGGRPMGRRPGKGPRDMEIRRNDALIDTKFQSSSLEAVSSVAIQRDDAEWFTVSGLFHSTAAHAILWWNDNRLNKSLMAFQDRFIVQRWDCLIFLTISRSSKSDLLYRRLREGILLEIMIIQ